MVELIVVESVAANSVADGHFGALVVLCSDQLFAGFADSEVDFFPILPQTIFLGAQLAIK